MSLSIEIPKKAKSQYTKDVIVFSPKNVYDIDEVQEIKDASQEHLLLIGMDKSNNVRNINLIGVGTSSEINIDRKNIIRTAIINGNEKVIMVHNHPSNSLKASFKDKEITNEFYKLFGAFNIQLLDHVIVTEESYISMFGEKIVDKNFKSEKTEVIEKSFLQDEVDRLTKENRLLKEQLGMEEISNGEEMED